MDRLTAGICFGGCRRARPRCLRAHLAQRAVRHDGATLAVRPDKHSVKTFLIQMCRRRGDVPGQLLDHRRG